MPKVVLQGYIEVPAAQRAVVESLLPEHIALTREEVGCLVFKVWPDEHDSQRYHVYEEFADRAAFEQHQLRVKRSRWGSSTVDLKRHYTVCEQ